MITEEIKAKAKEYAVNALQGQIDAIADAYLKGYEDALKTMPHKPIVEEYDTFVDLQLDSDTMWTSEYHKLDKNMYYELNYFDALEYGIPTEEQFIELFLKCGKEGERYYGRNNSIWVKTYLEPVYIWVKSEVEDNKALAYKIQAHQKPVLVKRHVGIPSYFLRVKNKSEQ